MHRIFISVLIGAVAAVVALVLPAGAAARSVGAPGAPTVVREYAGTVVFSQFDASTAHWSLAVRRAGVARVELLPVAPSQTPFDADIGPDSSGRPALIYQRCGGTPLVPTGCDLFVFSLDRATRERAVSIANDPANNDVHPTLWRGRIAWTREYSADLNRPELVVYTKALTSPRSRPSTRLPGVPQRRCDNAVCVPASDRRVEALELWGKNLAMTVRYSDKRELRLVDIGRRVARKIALRGVGLAGQALVGPSFFAGRLGWYETCLADASACKPDWAGALRYTLSTRRYEIAEPGPRRVYGFVDTGSQHYRVTGCSEEKRGASDAACRIDIVPAPTYRDPGKTRRWPRS